MANHENTRPGHTFKPQIADASTNRADEFTKPDDFSLSSVTDEAAARAEAKINQYLPPSDQIPMAAVAANFYTRKFVRGEDSGELAEELRDNFKPMQVYDQSAKAATREIDAEEQRIATEQWNSLPHENQQKMIDELEAWNQHVMKGIYGGAGPQTPELTRFEASLATKFVGLEKQREQELHKVWSALPVDIRRQLHQREEMRPGYSLRDS